MKANTVGSCSFITSNNESLHLNHIIHSPDITNNVISVRKLLNQGFDILFDQHGAHISNGNFTKTLLIKPTSEDEGGLWKLKLIHTPSSTNTTIPLTINDPRLPVSHIENEYVSFITHTPSNFTTNYNTSNATNSTSNTNDQHSLTNQINYVNTSNNQHVPFISHNSDPSTQYFNNNNSTTTRDQYLSEWDDFIS